VENRRDAKLIHYVEAEHGQVDLELCYIADLDEVAQFYKHCVVSNIQPRPYGPFLAFRTKTELDLKYKQEVLLFPDRRFSPLVRESILITSLVPGVEFVDPEHQISNPNLTLDKPAHMLRVSTRFHVKLEPDVFIFMIHFINHLDIELQNVESTD